MKYEKISPTDNYPYKIFSFQSKSSDRLIPPHWHESLELLFCFSGELEVIFAGQTYHLKAKECIIINSNHVHSTRSPILGECLVIQFPLEYLQRITEEQYLKKFLFSAIPEQQTKELLACLLFIYQNFSSNRLAEHLYVKAKVYELLAILCERNTFSSANIYEIKSFKYLEKMKVVNQYIQDHYTQNLMIEEVAKIFNYNPSYFSRFYKKFMGITFTEYLNSIRLDAAYKEMRDTDKTILEIGLNNGFATNKTFYNVFRNKFGMSPQKFRQQFLKKSN
ncbi:AraC family transcriptional regulator [Enterococcus devriesei]|uniref:AraC family transcriptional regulator n=1 Tax=Enterococcus devriesei TaxID=319970 RepID=UPI0036D3DA4C